MGLVRAPISADAGWATGIAVDTSGDDAIEALRQLEGGTQPMQTCAIIALSCWSAVPV